MAKKQPKVKASTQEHLDIEDIIDDLVVLKTGWVALVMSTTAVNFDLLSEAEQDATIYAHGAFLNSLTFPLQTLIRSKKADITAYFNTLEDAERNQPNPDLKNQITKYKDFIQATVQQKTVLDKKFYLVINYSTATAGFGLGKKIPTRTSKAQLVETAKVALAPRRDHVIKQTARLGLLTRQLTTQELVELFYDIYNPAPAGTQRVLLDSNSYTTPLVQPAIENPTAPPVPPAAMPSAAPITPIAPLAGAVPVEPNLRPVPPPPAPAQPAVSTGDLGSIQSHAVLADAAGLTGGVPARLPQVAAETAAPVVIVAPAAPVPPQPQVVQPASASSATNAQAQALANLQAAASKASQFVNRFPPAPPISAPQATVQGIPLEGGPK